MSALSNQHVFEILYNYRALSLYKSLSLLCAHGVLLDGLRIQFKFLYLYGIIILQIFNLYFILKMDHLLFVKYRIVKKMLF